eukprot:scaffold1141_cov128-Isochrysis_galbana.AAC.7
MPMRTALTPSSAGLSEVLLEGVDIGNMPPGGRPPAARERRGAARGCQNKTRRRCCAAPRRLSGR